MSSLAFLRAVAHLRTSEEAGVQLDARSPVGPLIGDDHHGIGGWLAQQAVPW